MGVNVSPAHCAHIADFYQLQWENRPCIGWNLLRHGYAQWAKSVVVPHNNLFALPNP